MNLIFTYTFRSQHREHSLKMRALEEAARAGAPPTAPVADGALPTSLANRWSIAIRFENRWRRNSMSSRSLERDDHNTKNNDRTDDLVAGRSVERVFLSARDA